MNFELQQKLFDRFSTLFIERHLPMTQTCMCWGLECGNGWYNLIWKMCEKLEQLNIKSFRFTQIKEKFGTLRAYYDYDLPKRKFRGLKAKERRKVKRTWKIWNYQIDQIICEAEEKSAITCSSCGNPGKRIGKSSWSSIICEKCNGEKPTG